MSGVKEPTEIILLSVIADALHVLVWQNTKDGVKGRNRPQLITETLLDQEKKTGGRFDSVEDFRAWRESMLRRE